MNQPKMERQVKPVIAFVCPTCAAPLQMATTTSCCPKGHTFPIEHGLPILIDDEKSVFSQSDFQKGTETFFLEPQSRARRIARGLLSKFLPDILLNLTAKKNYQKLAKLLKGQNNPLILIIGCGDRARWMEEFISQPGFNFVETDVSLGPRVQIVCDGHNLPFANGSFDAIIAQGVLEHVADSDRVVEEMHRVLKEDGLVFADSPFLVPGHFAPYDFRRFTIIGHRRLFRSFALISEGMSFGPAASLTWTMKEFATSLAPTRNSKAIVGFMIHILFFWIRYFDYILINKRDAFAAASGFYFMGRKADVALSDKQLVALYARN